MANKKTLFKRVSCYGLVLCFLIYNIIFSSKPTSSFIIPKDELQWLHNNSLILPVVWSWSTHKPFGPDLSIVMEHIEHL